ncbi:glycerophosphodiester phosphodiesterase family protein [Tropicibacter sp. Alg240-R139]|uniref:glycerophosphodiester phosphodiesterase family protein n=1 Tax=Tropicibacter sp. Alg240-R139 TaxID=2305991 RepID=UPI0013E0312D|nr:glycerophosphodiester phosphodiesterase family protein [Tropicibacter sp. Alg240-R139]
MIPRLPKAFLDAPIAHRGLHDATDGRPENSRAAIRAAMDAGYGIEIDLQMTSDAQAIVFHDYDMGRLTGTPGAIRLVSSEQAQALSLLGGEDERIPSLSEVLGQVGGRAPLLIELKDQDGAMGTNIGLLEQATATALAGYQGPVALMSFNPNSVALLADLLPDVPRGIVTSAYDPTEWPLPRKICDHLRDIPDYDRTRSSFISHEVEDLMRPRVAELRAAGADILCWTSKSADQDHVARRVAQNVTFEGYLAQAPG